jgi:hypothetical protein
MNRLQKLIVYAAASNNLYDYISKRLEEITGKPVSKIEQEYLSMTQVSQKVPAAAPASVPKATSYTSAPAKPVKPTAKPAEQTIQTEEDELKEEKTDTSKKEVKETSDAKENKSEPNKDFQEQYVKAKSVQERQKLILQYAQKPKQLHPISQKLPDGSTFTYYVMPNYLMIGNQLASVTPETAQILAKRWGMVLPTGKMVEQIHNEASRVGGALEPAPLSSTGYRDPVTGKQYTAEEVAKFRIGSPGANIAYSERIQKEMNKNPNAPIYSGHGKTIMQPIGKDTGQIFFKGIARQQNGKTVFIQQGTSGAHGTGARDTHEEYITGMQAASGQAEITKPDGTKMKVSLQDVMKNPKLYKLVSEQQGVIEYATKPTEEKKESAKAVS